MSGEQGSVNNGINNTGDGDVTVTNSAVGTNNTVHVGAGQIADLLGQVRALLAEHRTSFADPNTVTSQLNSLEVQAASAERDRTYVTYLLRAITQAFELAGVAAAPVAALAAAVTATFAG